MSIDLRAGMIPRPYHESFDMVEFETMAFWLMVLPEFDFRWIREYSALLYTQTKQLVTLERYEHDG
jgi:hypothetical protein